MKKILSMILAIVMVACVAACGSNEPTVSITLDDVTKALQKVDPSFAFDESDKPMFEMIGAIDGHMGYLNGTSPVKVYEYKDEGAYKEALKSYDMMEEWPKVGLFVLECSNEDVRAAFNSLAK